MADSNQVFLDMFSDRARIVQYADGPRRFTPGLDAVHGMTAILLAERVPHDAHVLVLGAGGGLELKALAQSEPGWRFTGVDPAGPMLDLARETLGGDAERAALVEGYIDATPAGPFDAATCLLTLHFLDRDERVRTLREMRRRMTPGAPLVVVHSSFRKANRPARAGCHAMGLCRRVRNSRHLALTDRQLGRGAERGQEPAGSGESDPASFGISWQGQEPWHTGGCRRTVIDAMGTSSPERGASVNPPIQ